MATVCLIEDDAGTRESLRFLLSDAGYEIVEAPNGIEGRALLEASAEGMVVVLDNWLPDFDGCALLNSAVQDAALRVRHAFIMISASPNQALAQCGEAIQALDVPLVSKPFDIDELLEAVRQAVLRLEAAA